ncbi:MAG: hypothetical protein RLZZ563_424 [Pseudomonadota bacterium]|jgi:hypothetical protein
MTALLRSRYFTWALLALPSLMMLKDYAAAGMTAHQLLHPSGEFGARAALPVTFAPDWYDRKVGSIVLMAGGWRDATRVGGRPQPNARK